MAVKKSSRLFLRVFATFSWYEGHGHWADGCLRWVVHTIWYRTGQVVRNKPFFFCAVIKMIMSDNKLPVMQYHNTNSQLILFCIRQPSPSPYIFSRAPPYSFFFLQIHTALFILKIKWFQPTLAARKNQANHTTPSLTHPSLQSSFSFLSPPVPSKRMSTRPTTYKFQIRWPQSSLVIAKGGFASFDAAFAYSQGVHLLSGYDLPECEQLGVGVFRFNYHEPAHDSSLLVRNFVCVVLVGPEGMNMQ